MCLIVKHSGWKPTENTHSLTYKEPHHYLHSKHHGLSYLYIYQDVLLYRVVQKPWVMPWAMYEKQHLLKKSNFQYPFPLIAEVSENKFD
jgi:hypothetical protein